MTGMLEVWLGRILKVLALMLILEGCGQPPPPPPAVPVALQVSPAALLLEPGGKSQVLSATAYGADGSKLEITDIEWLNSDPAQVQITSDPSKPGMVTVQAAGTIGTGVITARIRNQPTVFSDPVIISTAKLKPGVETLSDAQVVFPFPNVPSNVDLKGFKPDETSFGTQTMIGGFAEGEIAALYENLGGAFRYGVVLRGAAPSDGKLVVGAGGAEIAGRVIKSQARGNFVLVQLELPSLTEVFDEYSFKIDSAKLRRQGTLRQFKGQIKQKAQNRQAAGSANEGLWDCQASAGVQFVGSTNPPFEVGINPIWDAILEMKSGVLQKFYFKAGVDLVLKVNPEVKFEQGAYASLKCKPAKVWSRRFPLAGLLSAFLEPGLKFYPSLEVGGALTAGNSLRAGFKLDFSRSYWTGGTYTPEGGWKPLCSTWQECSNSNNTKSVYLEKSTFEKPMSINFKMGAYYNLVAGFQIGGELIGTIKDWFGSLPLIGEKIESIADELYIDLLTAKAGPETQTVWSNTEWVLFNEKNQSGANTYVAATLTATYPRLKTLILKLFKIPLAETPPPPLLALPQLNILEPYRNLIAESITSPSANPMTVKASQTLEVRATIARNVQWLQPITDLIALPLDVHTIWPHRAELWLKTGDSALGGNITHTKLGNLTVQNERILTGSFTVTADMCQKASLSLSKTVTIKLIAYNYMYNVVESPNYVGDFKISCSDLSAQPSPVQLRAKVKEKALGSFTIANGGSQDVNYTATGGGIVGIRSGASAALKAGTRSAVGLIATCPDSAGTYSGNAALAFKDTGGKAITDAPTSVAVTLECWKEKDPDPDPAKPKKPKKGGSHGDPHLITLDGRYYDFQGVGDYVLTKSSQDDFEVHSRFIPYGDSVSVNDAVAVRGNGDVVEVYSSPSGQPAIWINGQKQSANIFKQQLAGGMIVVAEAGRVSIVLPDGSMVSASLGTFLGSLEVYTVAERSSQLEGLLGDGNDDPSNDLRIRGGAVLSNPAPKDLYLEYRSSWRVPLYSAGSLFSQAPERWNFQFPPNVVSLEDLDPAKRAWAEQICLAKGITTPSVFDGCVYDVALTNDPSFANYAYGIDPNKLGILVGPPVTFVRYGQQKRFGAFVTGTNSDLVSWSTSCGHLSTDGNIATFTAPSKEQECEIKATLSADDSIVGKSKVLVGELNGAYWDGGGDDIRWEDPKNWSEDKLPTLDSDVILIQSSSELRLQTSSNPSVHSLRNVGNVSVVAGTINVAAGAITNGFKLEGGTLNSSGTVVLNGQTTWANGTLGGTGKFVNNGELSLVAGNYKYLAGTLENTGTIKISDNLYSGANSSVLKNMGTLEFVSDTAIVPSTGYISLQNSGLIVKTAGTGISYLDTDLVNTGTLEARVGTLRIDRGTLETGMYTATLGATLQLNNTLTLKGTLSGNPSGAVAVINANLNVNNSETTHLNFGGTGFDFRIGHLAGLGTLQNDNLMLFSGGNYKYLDGTLSNAGIIKMSDVLYSGAIGSVFKNTGTLEILGDTAIVPNTGYIALQNSGLIVKTGGTDIARLETDLVNTGTLESRSGTLRIDRGTLDSGVYKASAGQILRFSNDITYKGTLTGSPEGTLEVLNGNINVPNAQEAHLKFGGTGLNFAVGRIVGPGKLVNDANSLMNLAGGNYKYLDGTLENAGTIKVSDNLYSGSNTALLKNLGTLEFAGDSSLLENTGRISLENSGLLLKTGGAGITSLQLSTLTNTGTLESRSGILRIQDGVVIGGTYNATASGILELTGNMTVKGTLSGAPAGSVRFSNGNINIPANEATHLNFAGTGFDFQVGRIGGAGKLVNDGTMLFSSGNYKYLDGTLENLGTIKISDTLYSGNAGNLFRNAGTIELQSDAANFRPNSGAINLLNSGSVLKTAGSGVSALELGTLTNTGILEAWVGTLRIEGGTVIGGTYNALLGAILEFTGTITLKGTLSGTATGSIRALSANLQVLTGDVAHLNFGATGFDFQIGRIVGAGKLVNDGKMLFSGGNYKYLDGTLENAALLKIGDNFYSGTVGSTLRNLAGATLEFTNDSNILESSGRVTFSNAGTLLKSGGTGNSTITTNFSNTGTIIEASGHFIFTP